MPGAANKALFTSRRILRQESQAMLNRLFYEEVTPDKGVKKRGDWESKADAPEPGRGLCLNRKSLL